MGKFLLIIIGLLLSANVYAENNLFGKVVGVSDGDTITLLTNEKESFKVRFLGIDAPEKKQDFGAAAKKHLSDLVFQKEVRVSFKKKDRYGRILGKIMLGDSDINLAMVRAGLAWHYKQYAKEQGKADAESYRKAEADARMAGVGLWQQSKSAQPPWEFRKKKRKS